MLKCPHGKHAVSAICDRQILQSSFTVICSSSSGAGLSSPSRPANSGTLARRRASIEARRSSNAWAARRLSSSPDDAMEWILWSASPNLCSSALFDAVGASWASAELWDPSACGSLLEGPAKGLGRLSIRRNSCSPSCVARCRYMSKLPARTNASCSPHDRLGNGPTSGIDQGERAEPSSDS